MREIKFRAWWYNQKKMDSDLSIERIAKTYSMPLDWCKLMQYTGLKDKNGVEIYEGDIFRAPHDFGPGGFSVRTSSVPTEHNFDIQWQYWKVNELEIIGNIYENPELLEDNSNE